MRAIILAAGRGSRIGDISNIKPKCLVDVGGGAILGHQLLALEQAGIKDITIVIGYLGNQIIEYCKELYSHLHINIIKNNDWQNSNNAYSLLLALEQDDSPFIWLNADTIFHPDMIERLLETKENAMACQKKECYTEEMKVSIKNNFVIEVTKDLNKFNNNIFGEFMGIAVFYNDIKEFINRLKLCENNHWVEHAIENLIKIDNKQILGIDCTEFPCMEIDFEEELEEANDIFLFGREDWEFGIRHGSKRNQEEIFLFLKEFSQLLNKYNIEHWLNWGTLLGVYRDKKFIEWDNDNDISYHTEDLEKVWETIVPLCRKKGWFVPKRENNCDGDCWIIHPKYKEKIEFNDMIKIKDKYVYSPTRSNLYCPSHHIDTLDKLNFNGYIFNIPSDTDNYLKGWYGNDWQTPIKDKKPESY